MSTIFIRSNFFFESIQQEGLTGIARDGTGKRHVYTGVSVLGSLFCSILDCDAQQCCFLRHYEQDGTLLYLYL